MRRLAGDQRPAPGAEHRGEQARSRGRRQRRSVDPAQPVQEDAGAQAPEQDAENRYACEGAEMRPQHSAGAAQPARGRRGPGILVADEADDSGAAR